MMSTLGSNTSGTSTSKDNCDDDTLFSGESPPTSAPSIPLNISEPLKEKEDHIETSLGENGPENGANASEKGGIVASLLETPHPSIRKDLVSVETLKIYNIDHHIDPADPDSIIIDRAVPDYEIEFLKKHTEELKKKRVDQMREETTVDTVNLYDEPLDNPVQQLAYSGYFRPGHEGIKSLMRPSWQELQARPDSPSSPVKLYSGSSLLLQKYRVPFEKWRSLGDEIKRGLSVLDVAMTTEAHKKSPDMPLLSNSSIPKDACKPIRLAINSTLIQTQLRKITKIYFDNPNIVLYPPWKLLVTYRDGIKKCLHELERKAEDRVVKSVRTDSVLPNKAPLDAEETTKSQVEASTELTKDVQDLNSTKPCEVCWNLHDKSSQCLDDAVNHFKIFVDFIDNDLKHVFELRQGLASGSITEIAFEDLWHLYSPGQLLVTSGLRRERQAYRVYYTCGGRSRRPGRTFEKAIISTPFMIHCYCMEIDKKWIGPVNQIISIPRYDGKRLITALPMSYSNPGLTRTGCAFPIEFLEDHKTVVSDLIKRGKRLCELIPFSHKRYIGPSTVEDPEYLNSEIIIDIDRQEENTSIGVFESVELDIGDVPEGCNLGEPCFGCSDIFDDNQIDKERAVQYKQDQHLLIKRGSYDENLTDEHFMLLPNFVDAFVLRERDLFGLYVDLVQDLDGDRGESLKALKKQSGFEDLVLPQGHGDLVEALVRNHRSTRNQRDEDGKVQVDLIDGKGEGLIILLHGVPGVGKTSTAECVAAYTRRPLYPITCANIGLEPEQVEDNLTGPSGHFRKAQQWNCVVLLDEADVFLAKRETGNNDAKRNALVSVFLRTLEYYPGILILTTNRVGSFDEAVISRIQLFLYYPPLDEDQTMRVWRVHINRVRSSDIINIDHEDEEMIMDFAKEEYTKGRRWNGRQIRNFFQTAISLASYDATQWRQQSIKEGQIHKDSKPSKPRLTTRTLKKVAATTGKFIDYIEATLPDTSHERQQLTEGNRNDKWEETSKKNYR